MKDVMVDVEVEGVGVNGRGGGDKVVGVGDFDSIEMV